MTRTHGPATTRPPTCGDLLQMNSRDAGNLISKSQHHKLYVVEFASGVIKVGQSANAKQRVWAHGNEAGKRQDDVRRTWVSDGHLNAVANERALIAFCSERYDIARGKEYFNGADFDAVVAFANSLPFESIPQEEIDAHHRERMREVYAFEDMRKRFAVSGLVLEARLRLKADLLLKYLSLAGLTSYARIAEAMGIDEQHVAQIFAGERPLDTAFVTGVIAALGDTFTFADLWEVAPESAGGR